MNKLFTKVGNFAETPGFIANAADKLLSHMLPKDDAAAICFTRDCGGCHVVYRGYKKCRRCCSEGGCYDLYKPCTQ